MKHFRVVCGVENEKSSEAIPISFPFLYQQLTAIHGNKGSIESAFNELTFDQFVAFANYVLNIQETSENLLSDLRKFLNDLEKTDRPLARNLVNAINTSQP